MPNIKKFESLKTTSLVSLELVGLLEAGTSYQGNFIFDRAEATAERE